MMNQRNLRHNHHFVTYSTYNEIVSQVFENMDYEEKRELTGYLTHCTIDPSLYRYRFIKIIDYIKLIAYIYRLSREGMK